MEVLWREQHGHHNLTSGHSSVKKVTRKLYLDLTQQNIS